VIPNNKIFSAFLQNRAVISLTGDDTIDFLQGLISNDARPLANGNSIYAALLSPQGKFLHDFFLIPWREKIFIDVSAERAVDLLSRLKIYRLRSKVEMLIDESLCVAALWGGELEYSEQFACKIYSDPRLPEIGYRVIGTRNSINDFVQKNSCKLVMEEEYESFRLSLSVPDTRDMIVEKSLLMECGFEELHGVDFSKGCYVGQEVTARSKFRGQVRKSFYKMQADKALPAIGTPIMAGDKSIGELRTSLDNTGIALIHNDEYEVAKNAKVDLLCGGIKIRLDLAIWIKNSK
jgi:folate-binding protein YgfZ